MIKRFLISLLLTLCCIIYMTSTLVHADTTSDNYNNYVYPMSTYKMAIEEPFSIEKSGQTEVIDPASGNLEISFTDLYLKGKNGLDLELRRIYNLAYANFLEPVAMPPESTLNFIVKGYYIVGTETKEKYINGVLSETTHRFVYITDNNPSVIDDYKEMNTNWPDKIYEPCWQYPQQAQRMADKFNNGDFNKSTTTISGNNTIVEVIKYNDKGDFRIQLEYVWTEVGAAIVQQTVYRGGSNSDTATDKYFNLGTGWSFDLPFIERRGTEDKYFHYPQKGVLHFTYNIEHLEYLISPYHDELVWNFDEYSLDDIELYRVFRGKYFFNNGQMSTYFMIKEKDGKEMHFGSDGRLLGIRDRFGNTITFRHDTSINGYPLITRIIDSLGRTININYESNRVRLEIIDDTNTNNKKTIIYNKKQSVYSSNEFVLDNIVDPEGRITRYEYIENDTMFSFQTKHPYPDPTVTICNNAFACLTKITYPTGGRTEYEYTDSKYTAKNLGIMGFQKFFKIASRADYTEDGTRYNYKSFKYKNYFNGDGAIEYDGYPFYAYNSIPSTHTVLTEANMPDGNKEVYTYKYIANVKDDKGIVCTNILFEGDNHKREIIKEYDSYRLPIKVVERLYNKASDAIMDKIENFSYDVFGDLKYYWNIQAGGNTGNSEHKISYTYDNDYHYIRTKQYKKDANTTILEEYIPFSDDKRKIEWFRVKENGILKKQVRFIYDEYGNVIEEQNFLDDWVNYISTRYSYDDNVAAREGKFNGGYITRKWTDNIKDADGQLVTPKTGNSNGVIDEILKYDWFGNIIKRQDSNGGVFKYEYDKIGRKVKEINPDLSFKTWEYVTDLANNYVVTKDENANSISYCSYGNQMKFEFDDLGNLKFEKIYALNDSGSFEYKTLKEYLYDSNTRISCEKDYISGSHTNYLYNSDGKIKTRQITDALNSGVVLYKEDYSYIDADESGSYSVITKTIKGDSNSPDIVERNYTNKAGFLSKVERVHVDKGVAKRYIDSFEYDYLGNKIEEKAARAYDEGWTEPWTAKYEYNYAGNIIKEINIKGDFITTEYDALGRVKKVTDIKGNKSSEPYSTEYIYDNLGRVIEERTPFEKVNGVTYYTIKRNYYDRNGNLIKVKTSRNKPGENLSFNQTEYRYDNRNRLTMVIAYDGENPVNYTQYYYDAVGNKVRMYTGLSSPLTINGLDNITVGGDAEYSVTKYKYNSLGKITEMTDPLGKTETYEYNLNGNLIRKIDRNSNVLVIDYDCLNRIITESVVTPDDKGNVSHTYTYTLTGKRKTADNTTYFYDDLGRLIKETSGNITKEYEYDAANNRKLLKIMLGSEIKINTAYTYDKLNRLETVSENGQIIATYTYDDNGNRESLSYSNVNTTTYTYNLANRLKTLTNKRGSEILSNYTYTYYLDGNQASKTDQNNKVTSYQYDGLGLLISEIVTGSPAVNYTYDDYNNRKTMAVSGVSTTTYTYDKNNRLITETKVTGNTTEITRYGYDDNGNQIYKSTDTIRPAAADDTESYTISILGENEPTGNIIVNEYNGLNQLIKTKVGDKTITYTYNTDGLRTGKTVNGAAIQHIWDGDQIVLELNGSGQITGRYIRGINLICADDGTDTNRKWYLYNGHGDVVQLTGTDGRVSKTYDYDAFGNEKNPDPDDTNPFRYCGEYFDLSSGTYYLRARYYDPATSRMLSEDPIRAGLNWYTYCDNNPVLFCDPNGLEAVVVSGGAYSDTTGYRYHFIEPAIKWIREMRNPNATFYIGDETIAWLIADAGWTDDDWAAFNLAVKDLNVNVVKVGSKDDLIDYVNNKNGGDSRNNDQITKFTVFSHGWQGTMSLGYNYTSGYNKELDFNISDINSISYSAFNNPASWFGSCNLGTGGKNSFGQAWVNRVGGTTWAFEGKTDYTYIVYPKGYVGWQPWWWGTRYSILKARKEYGFIMTGSYRYPIAGKDAKEVKFTRE